MGSRCRHEMLYTLAGNILNREREIAWREVFQDEFHRQRNHLNLAELGQCSEKAPMAKCSPSTTDITCQVTWKRPRNAGNVEEPPSKRRKRRTINVYAYIFPLGEERKENNPDFTTGSSTFPVRFQHRFSAMSAIPELENVPEVDTVKPAPEQPPIAPVQAVESIPEQPEVTQSGTTVRSEQQYMSPKPQGTIALRHEGRHLFVLQ